MTKEALLAKLKESSKNLFGAMM